MIAGLLILGLLVPNAQAPGHLPPQDTVLVEVMNVTTAERLTVEAIAQDSTLLLPAGSLQDLFGTSFTTPWVSLDQLRQAYPVTVLWQKALGRVVVFDDLGVLPATRRFRAQHRASAFGTVPIPAYSGFFGSAAVDDQRRALAELGFLYKGRLSVAGRVDDHGTSQWAASAAATSHVFVGATGGTGRHPSFNARVQAGPLWFLTSYTNPTYEVAGLVRAGPVAAFASTQFGMLTITPSSQLTVQLAQRWEDRRTVGRISFGPTYASPFSFPVSSLTRR